MYLLIFPADQGQFEAILGGVNVEHTRAALAVQAVYAVPPHTCHVDGQVQRADDAVITAERQEKKLCNQELIK